MSNRSSRIGTKPVSRKQRKDRRRGRDRRRPPWLWIGLIAIVVIAGVVAVIGSRGSNHKTAALAARNKTAGIEQTRPVIVSGTPLPPLSQADDAAVGMPAPQVTGNSFDGTPVSIRSDGRPKLLVFVAHWCPHCQREVPLLVSYFKAHPLASDVDLLAVATSTSADRPNYPPSEWLHGVGWTAPVIADSAKGDAATAYGLTSFPYFVAVDRTGKVAARAVGELSTDAVAQIIAKATR